MLPWILCVILAVIAIALTIKILLMQKSMKEICDCMTEHLSSDTNQLITVSSGDRHVRRLASRISKQLSVLREQRRRYLTGDRELKEAVTNISHDLRTPLTAICGYLDLLSAEECSADAARYVALIRERAEVLRRLMEELFRYSVISSTPKLCPENVDVRGILEDTLVSFYAALAEKGIVPEISLPEGEIRRYVDAAAVSRVFENIIGNAVKYSDGDLFVSVSEDGSFVFSNSASELSAVDVGKLFDRFYTVDTARRSTGLGLSIAKLLAERMNGSISAHYSDRKLHIAVSFPNGN